MKSYSDKWKIGDIAPSHPSGMFIDGSQALIHLFTECINISRFFPIRSVRPFILSDS